MCNNLMYNQKSFSIHNSLYRETFVMYFWQIKCNRFSLLYPLKFHQIAYI